MSRTRTDLQPGFTVRQWLRSNWVVLVLVVAALGFSGTWVMFQSAAFSQIDEYEYVDYLFKFPKQGFVHKGELLGTETRNALACDGVVAVGLFGLPCGSEQTDATLFPWKGVSSADPYTPVYFAATWVIGAGIRTLSGLDWLTAWRLSGPLWLAAGMVVFTLLLRRWRVPELAILGLGLIFIGSPFSFWTYSYVSTDAPCFFFGALLLLLADRLVREGRSGWWFVTLSVIAALIKVTNVLSVGLAVLYVLVDWALRQWRPTNGTLPIDPTNSSGPRPRTVLIGMLAAFLSVLTEAAWLVFNKVTAVSSLTPDQGIGHKLTARDLLAQSVNFLPGVFTTNPNSILAVSPLFVVPLSWLCIAAVVGAVWSLNERSDTVAVTVSTAIAAVTFAPLLSVALQVSSGTTFDLPPRYGATIVAAFLLLAGMSIKNRITMWAIAGYGLFMALLITYVARWLG